MSLGKFRIIFHITSDRQDGGSWFEIAETRFFQDGFESDFDDRSCSAQDWIEDIAGDIADEILDNADEVDKYKINDVVEFVGDLCHESSRSWEGEYDEQFWMENIEHKKLGFNQVERYFENMEKKDYDEPPKPEPIEISLKKPFN